MKNRKFVAFLIAILTILYIFPFRLSPSGVFADELIASKVQNSVVLVTFETTGNAFASGFEKDLYAMYQTSDYSVKNYLALQSGNKMDFNTTMLYGENGRIVRSDYPVEYYRPRYEWVHSRYEEINQIGYDNRYFNQAGEPVSPYRSNAKISIDGALREQKFIREIVDKISFNSNYSSDKNGDGLCDSLVIVTDCSLISSREDILWPHKGTAYTFTQSILNAFYSTGYESACALVTDKIVKDGVLSTYSLLSSKEITSKRLGDDNKKVKESEKDLYHIGLLTHETLHALGMADYYSYEDGAYESVGEFDLMGSTHVLPQNMLGYLRFKAGWLSYDDILYINDSGSYTLPLSMASGKSVAKIVLSDYHETGEYFMAEFRSSYLANEDNPYDGALSGDGLIIYRINPENAFINPKGQKGAIDYGNMYGDDEVFVYRLGAPSAIKKVTSLTGESYAAFGSGKKIFTIDGTGALYDNTTFGNSDKDKTAQNLFSSKTTPSETIIYYSNGKNSGIVFSNITIDNDAQTVSFKVELPEKQGSVPFLVEQSVSIDKNYNGKNLVKWVSDIKSGTAHILVVRSTNRIKSLAQSGKTGISISDFQDKKFSGYETLYYASLPCAEMVAELPTFDKEALVFIAIESESGKSAVRFVGHLVDPNPTFWDYYRVIVDPVYYIALIVAVLIIMVACYGVAQGKKKNDSKRVYKK